MTVTGILNPVVRQFGNIAGGNFSEFETDGTLVFNGNATVWDDQQVDISSVRLPVSGAPTWVAYKGGQVLSFSGSQDNVIYFTAQLSHRIKTGSNIEFHIHYVPEDNTAGNARWVFTHSWSNAGAAFPSETTVIQLLATPEITDQHVLGDIATTITGTGKTISSILICSLTRTGTHGDDTYDSKAIYLTALDFHFEIDTAGSRQENVK